MEVTDKKWGKKNPHRDIEHELESMKKVYGKSFVFESECTCIR